jgi:hypothetical protein
MADRLQNLLLGYLIGALDDSERRRVQRRLQSDPAWRSELAAVRESLEPLRAAQQTYEPPADLADRTCRYLAMFAPPVARPAARSPARERRAQRRARRMTAAFAPPSSRSSWSWADLSVAAAIVVLLSLLAFPAVQNSRVHARMMACQSNLRAIGENLVRRQESHPELVSRELSPAATADFEPTAPLVYCAAGANRNAMDISRDVLDVSRNAVDAGLPIPTALVARSNGRPQRTMAGGSSSATHNGERMVPAAWETSPDVPSEVSLGWLAAPRPGHPGISDSTRGQNALFADGRVTFVSTSLDRPSSEDDWMLDRSSTAGNATLTVVRP